MYENLVIKEGLHGLLQFWFCHFLREFLWKRGKHKSVILTLKTLDTFGNCQKTSVLTRCIPTCKNNDMSKSGLTWSLKLQENKEGEKTIVAQCVCFNIHSQMLQEVCYCFEWEIPLSRKNYVTSEGAVYHNVFIIPSTGANFIELLKQTNCLSTKIARLLLHVTGKNVMPYTLLVTGL